MSPITWVDPQVALLRQVLSTLTNIENELRHQNEMIQRGGETVVTDADMLGMVREYDHIHATMPSLGDDA